MPILNPVIIEQFGYARPVEMINRFPEKEIAELIDDSGLITAKILKDFLIKNDITELTDSEKAALSEGMRVLCRACHDADSIISAHLVSAGIETPMQAKNLMIDNIACDIARYYLYDIQVPEIVERRYRDAIDVLTKIMKGQIKLEGSQQYEGYGVDIVSETPRFTLRTL